MKQRDKPYEEIYDLLAIRVLVNTVPDCYHALGVIHDGWTPVQERIKDYIAQPKSNGYQSLHTTVFGPGRQLYEIQIRTREMHRTADYGIAAHWLYKEDAKSADELDRHLTWFRQVLELQLDAKTPDEFLEFLKLDLYAGRDLRLHAERATSSSCRRARRRSTSRSRCTPRSGCTAPARRSTAASRRCRAQLRNSEHGRDHHVARRRSRAATGSRTCARAARATRSASGCATRSRRRRRSSGRRSSSASCKRRRLPKPDDATLDGRRARARR